MAPAADTGALRAGVAALVAVAVLVAFALWLSVDEALRTSAIEARRSGERATVVALARDLEAAGASASDADLLAIVQRRDEPLAAAVYGADGRPVARAAGDMHRELLSDLPEHWSAEPPSDSGEPPEVRAPERRSVVRLEPLRDGRGLAVAIARRPLAPWAETFAGYQVLTLGIVIAGIALLFVRIRRFSPSVRREGHVSGSLGDVPTREADFVVETFQSVIGELRDKGKELELRSERERERADRSERFSERVIAQMPTGLVVVDRMGRITAANASARDLIANLPRERSEAVDHRAGFVRAQGLSRLVAACLDTGKSFQREEIALEPESAGEGARCLGVSVTPIAPSGDSVEAALVLMTDLTEVVDLRDRVRARETLASLGEMAAGLTHELKNSLATIQGYAQLLAGLAPEAATEPSEALVAEVRALSRMVTDFLNFAKPQDLALAPVPLAPLVESAAERLAERMASASIAFSLAGDSAESPVAALADESLLLRAILNLLQNAVEALETVDRDRHLDVRVRSGAGTDVVLEVRDNGPGIPPDDVGRIFIPFFTTRSRGYGIGLALTQKIILAHGGRIDVENGSPGAVFRCRLPGASPDGT